MLQKFWLLLLLVVTVLSNEEHNGPKLIRSKRGFSFWGFFQTVGNMKGIVDEQYNDTLSTLSQVYDLLADSFSDTATATTSTQAPSTSTTDAPGTTAMPSSTTTEKYRISRLEFGQILGRNYRGLKKLYDIEKADADNASRYNIQEYKNEIQNAVADFASFDDAP